jgi:hypothetical protein
MPIPLPITEAQTMGCLPARSGKVEGFILLTNDYRFWFNHGHVQMFSVGTPYRALQDPKLAWKYFGEVRITKSEAISAARTILKKLGYTDHMFNADLDPKVVEPRSVQGRWIARYNVEWEKPNVAMPSVEMEIDAASGRLLFITFTDRRLWKDDPVVDVDPPVGTKSQSNEPITDQLERDNILKRASPLIEDAITRLGFAVGDAKGVKRVELVHLLGRDFGGKAVLMNGFAITFYGNATEVVVSGFQAPDIFFNADEEIDFRAFQGKRILSETQAIKVARDWVRRFDSAVKLKGKPLVERPNLPANIVVPRCKLLWVADEVGVMVEVDLESGVVKQLSVDK